MSQSDHIVFMITLIRCKVKEVMITLNHCKVKGSHDHLESLESEGKS